jgi:hypothetical protein
MYIFCVKSKVKSTVVLCAAQPCYFTKQLMGKREIEHRTVTLQCQVHCCQLLANFLGQPCNSKAFSQQKKDHLNKKIRYFY